MAGEATAYVLVALQYGALALLALILSHHRRRTEAENAALRESNKAVIAEIRNHFPRFKDEPPEEVGI